MNWIKADPKIGDYYFCHVDTKQDCIAKAIVEWAEHRNGEHKYFDWDLKNATDVHGNSFPEDAEVIEYFDESQPSPQPEGKTAEEILENDPYLKVICDRSSRTLRLSILKAMKDYKSSSHPAPITTGLSCLDCQKSYDSFPIDIVLPDEEWKLIHPEEKGVLCASCIVERASKLPSVTALYATLKRPTQCE